MGHLTSIILGAIDNLSGDSSISDIEKACPLVGRDMISHVLNKLRGHGKVVNLSKGRYARWRKIYCGNNLPQCSNKQIIIT